jgi:hypothetical protein
MAYEFCRAETPDEIAAVQRLRYSVYVEELGRYRGAADEEHGRFVEPEDDWSWNFYVRDGEAVVAASRLTWGGDGFSDRQIEQYQLEPFLAELPPQLLAVAERYAVVPEHRGAGLLDQMIEHNRPFVEPHGLRMVISCCEPHLLSMYLARGQRPYAARNINSVEAGYLIPLVTFVPDVESLRGAGADTKAGELPSSVEAVLAKTTTVQCQSLSEPTAYWDEIHGTLDTLHAQNISAFDGFTDDEAQRCIARSNIIECRAGDRVLKRGGSARNIFVVLEGTLEVRDDERVVGVLSPGDAFGEMAFLLDRPRSFDVDAATAEARILSLSEGSLRRLIADDPTVAAKLLLNLSKMLCVRLIRAN